MLILRSISGLHQILSYFILQFLFYCMNNSLRFYKLLILDRNPSWKLDKIFYLNFNPHLTTDQNWKIKLYRINYSLLKKMQIKIRHRLIWQLSEYYDKIFCNWVKNLFYKMELNSFLRSFENRGKDGSIRCIFFCDFHPTAGPIISCQVCQYLLTKLSNNSNYF